MAQKARAMRIAAEALGIINDRYDMYHTDVDDIYKNSPDTVTMILNAFRFGYMQGIKAEKAATKKTNKNQS